MPHAVAGELVARPECPLTGVEQAEDEREQQGSCRDFPQAEDCSQDGDGHQAHRDKWRPHDEWPFWVARTRLPRTDRALPVCRSTSGASSELMRLTFEGSIAASGPCCSSTSARKRAVLLPSRGCPASGWGCSGGFVWRHGPAHGRSDVGPVWTWHSSGSFQPHAAHLAAGNSSTAWQSGQYSVL